jgi:hypothetical protein
MKGKGDFRMNEVRVQRQFDERYVPVPEIGCWLWLHESQPARRTAWLLEHGAKPVSQLSTSCGSEGCVNPAHLRLR